MKRLFAKMSLIGVLVLSLGGPAVAADMHHWVRHHATGTITAINSRQIVVKETVRGRPETISIALNGKHHRTGSLSRGDRVSVHYFKKHHERIATSVRDLAA